MQILVDAPAEHHCWRFLDMKYFSVSVGNVIEENYFSISVTLREFFSQSIYRHVDRFSIHSR
jgi:hypothetical protein